MPALIDRHQLLMAAGLLLTPGLAVSAARRIRVLIIDGVSNHDWRLTTKMLRAVLTPTGLFDITVSTSPPTADAPDWDQWRPDFGACDVVLQTYNDINGGPTWPEAVKSDFEAWVRKGGGVYFLHSANNAFSDWPAYNEMIGLGWRQKDFGPAIYINAHEKPVAIPAGDGEDTGHGKRFDALVHRIGNHPVHKDFPRAWMTADVELYRYGRGPAHNLTVLSYALEPKTGRNWPMEWTVTYGRGRSYVANYGHVWKGDVQPVTLRSVDVEVILIRALQWLARRKPDYPLPSDFPTADAVSIRPELVLPE